MHRGAEKLFEVRDYRQIIVLANRHDWLSAFANELGVVLAVERMLGMEVPVRAVWARTLLAELNRVLNHLMFLGSYPLEVGRDHAGLLRLPRARGAAGGDGGGLRRPDALHVQPGRRPQGGPAGRLDRPGPADRRRRPPAAAGAATTWSSATRSSGRGPRASGVLSAEQVLQYGVSGPIARASGRRLRPAARRALPRLRRARRDGALRRGDPRRRATASRASRCCSEQIARVARPRRRLPGPAGRAAAGTDQRAAAEGAEGARGRDLRVDREPAGHQRLLPGLARREDAVAAQAALGVVQQRAGAARAAARARCSPTWSRSSARCSSSSATSTSERSERGDGSEHGVVGDIDT